jgi:hypothetical protein
MQKLIVKSKILHAVKEIKQDNKKPKTKGITVRFAEHNLRRVMQLLQKKTLTISKYTTQYFFSS